MAYNVYFACDKCDNEGMAWCNHSVSFDLAQKRLEQTIQAGFMPYAMLYRDDKGQVDREWSRFQREWLRPAIVSKKFGEVWHKGLPEGEEDA